MKFFDEILSEFSDAERATILAALDETGTVLKSTQIRINVQNERALPKVSMINLFRVFLQNLESGTLPLDAWVASCRAHQLQGAVIPTAIAPRLLGRAKTLQSHLGSLMRAAGDGGLSPENAERLLVKHAGQDDPTDFEWLMRESMLGDYTIWATFDEQQSSRDPFYAIPPDHPSICTALGLGMFPKNELMLLLVWGHLESGSPDLYRPTVADAADYSYFRPCEDDAKPWGMTHPLEPNPYKLPPRAEVVLASTSCQGLVFPYHLLQPQ